MSMQNRLKARGIAMLVIFVGILGVIFSPVFPGKINGLDYLDNMFNMVSKGSSYFIPGAIKDSEKYTGKLIDVKIKLGDENQAVETARLMETAGAQVAVAGQELSITGDMAKILKSSLADSDQMFANNGAPIQEKYGIAEKQVLYNWFTAFKSISNELTKQEKFAEAKPFSSVSKKALEPAYNYYGVQAMNWKENIVMILVALGFYVFYTVWYGFGLMYLFEGLGLKIGH
ncbi:hypothetical protein [Desulfopila aestuarii]|uniref:Uncharacterized protein n=1 Tax=Desulfopila aestuarii DSM 18488 TaxID=1121416 RepID=A0A1M7Y7E2_9BACT|nr:hypothetical protein [Desulfopila aestuarii]SHO48534.1 hypothetical protein SAMN02745220_02352 [Desulfopila aestuarii DSM 18488]